MLMIIILSVLSGLFEIGGGYAIGMTGKKIMDKKEKKLSKGLIAAGTLVCSFLWGAGVGLVSNKIVTDELNRELDDWAKEIKG